MDPHEDDSFVTLAQAVIKTSAIVTEYLDAMQLTAKKVQSRPESSMSDETTEVEQVSAEPAAASSSTDVIYREKMSPLRLGSKHILNKLSFNYKDLALAQETPSRKKMTRLAQEITDIATSLPCNMTNSMFIRLDSERTDVMKVLITGVHQTPYASGCFEFDIYCPSEYPDCAPKVNLSTTGSGAIRFNPNLYANGKVCLSLLGTWAGKGGETWNAATSTLLQVCASIQSLIMTEDVYFNEPNYEDAQGTPEGTMLNRGYCNIVRYGTLKFAILGQITSPSPSFEKVILFVNLFALFLY